MVTRGEERKLVTVLFADLVGSTALADDQDPERTRTRLDRFYREMAAEIEGAGGTVEKFAGDAVMAVFGAPDALEDHAERALHAALSMHSRLERVFGGELVLRIGVNTGEVVVGEPRAGSSFVSGDAVNVAARLEQAAGAGEVLAGERAVASARGAFEFGERRTVEAKGKRAGVRCRPVVRALSLMRPRGVAGLAQAFVGRESELQRIHDAYRRVAERGRPELVTVLGEAGVGKTRLVRELWGRLADEDPEPTRRTGRCLAYGSGITYWPLGEVLKEHLGILESDPPDVVRRRLGDDEILGLTLGLELAGELHPLAARDRLHDAWIALLEDLARERPVVLLVEDVHWAEDPLLDLIERLAQDVTGPLLVLATARPDFAERPAWSPRLQVETILLEPLGDAAAVSLVETLVAGDLPAQIRDLVVGRAEGNPFFVEEVLGSLIDAGVLERVGGSWRAHELPPGFEIPDSVLGVLASRIDLLDEPERAALQAAAVIGRIFWTGPVYELVEDREPDLRMLEHRDFIRRRSGSSFEAETEFAFKHALTREVAYGGLTRARRAHLHARFAGWIERVGHGRDEHAPLLAHHYAEAVRPDQADIAWAEHEADELARLRARAVVWLRRAAELAIGRGEIDEAIALLRQALDLAPGDARAELWRMTGSAQALRFDGEAFWTAMERSLEASQDRSHAASVFSELAFQTTARSGMWMRRPDPDVVRDWVNRAIETSDPGSADRVKALIAAAYWDLSAAERDAGEASALAETLGDSVLRSYAMDAQAMIAFRAYSFAEAWDWEFRRFDLIDDISDPDHVHDIHMSAIPACIALGRFAEARRLCRANEDVTRRLTPHHRLHALAIALEIEECAGEWSAIRERGDAARNAARDNAATPCVRNERSLLLCALAHEYLGDGRASRRLEDEAAEFRMEGHGAILDAPRIRLALARGDLRPLDELLADTEWLRRQSWFALPAAAARLDALAAIDDREGVESDAEPLLVPNTYLEPFALRALGRVRRDPALVRSALERFLALGLDWHADQTRALL
jgi:class 3 adenylate cyclase